jgi:hypothetical protein
MRNWLFHPLIFYPLAIVFAVLVITISVRPQSLPRDPAPVAGRVVENALVYAGPGFDSPANSAEQNMTVTRDFWGRPRTLRIAVLPNHAAPTPAEQGVRVLLTPQDAARIANRPVTVEVSYNPLPVNAAQGLAVSLQGSGATAWVGQTIRPQPATVRFELPPQTEVNAIGLRALNEGAEAAFGLEITRIRVIPRA